MRHKIRVPPCRYCHRVFARREHLQRHERTHTNEKPHSCSCGRAFSRRDLLARHIKVIDDGQEHAESNSEQMGSPRLSPVPTPESSIRSVASVGASLVPSEREPVSPGRTPSIIDPMVSAVEDQDASQVELSPWNSLDLLWGDIDINPGPIDYTFLSSGVPFNFSSLEQYGILDSFMQDEHQTQPSAQQNSNLQESLLDTDLSRLPSRLPSLAPEGMESLSSNVVNNPLLHPPPSSRTDSSTQAGPPRSPWHVSHDMYQRIVAMVQEEKLLLPMGFQFPTKHAFSRYFEGFSGYHSHLPFLHFQTTDISKMTLELILAIAAIGAQYRFERPAAVDLCLASKHLIDARFGRDNTFDFRSKFTSTTCTSESTYEGMNVNQIPVEGGEPKDRSSAKGDSAGPLLPNIETLQAMIIIMSLCTWNCATLLPLAFALADRIANHLRQGCYLDTEHDIEYQSWHEWAVHEGRRRTVLVAYLLFNLHTVVYNLPPRLMSSEIWFVKMPQPEAQWQASTALEWSSIRQGDLVTNSSFGDCYSDLFATGPTTHQTSAFTNLIMIHALLQQIHLARESLLSLRFDSSDKSASGLPNDVETKLKSALQRWQRNWSLNAESTMRPISAMGPLGFNSTALFRVACLRVYFNLGPYRKFETRDPARIADALKKAPAPHRSPELHIAVLQCAHALSIPVRVGIQYVATTQTLTWSIVHCVCNLECALFLNKWLERLSQDEEPLTQEERRLVRIIASVLMETPYLDKPAQSSMYGRSVIEQMSRGVISLVADTFRGAHIFPLMDFIVVAVDRYSSSLESRASLAESL